MHVLLTAPPGRPWGRPYPHRLIRWHGTRVSLDPVLAPPDGLGASPSDNGTGLEWYAVA